MLPLQLGTYIIVWTSLSNRLQTLKPLDIIHGDIKPQNILVFKDSNGDFVVKVADFGYSTILAGKKGVLMPKSEPWFAPEWEKGCEYSRIEAQKMDAYSFGMLCLWFCFYGFVSMIWKIILDWLVSKA